MKRTLLILCFIIFLTGFSFGQMREDEARSAAMDAKIKDTLENARRNENQRQFPSRTGIRWGILTEEQKKLITPSTENLIKHKEFLKGSKTGIIKLRSNPLCGAVLNVNDTKCFQLLPIRRNGSIYSFKEKTHINPNRVDISYVKDRFIVEDSGFIVDLGNVSIDSVNFNTEEVKVINNFIPTTQYSELLTQRAKLNEGVSLNNKNYSKTVLAKLDTTYILRSVNYYNAGHYLPSYFYDDILLAFRVVEKDSDGAVTLIWKELKKGKNIKVSR